MTSTTKSAQFRDVAVSTGGNLVKAAKIAGTGYAGIGLQLTTRGYRLARRELKRRRLSRAAASARTTALSAAGTDRRRVSSRNRKLIVGGVLVGSAAGIALLATKRRHTPEPPAEAPPSLEDYADTPTSVNGSSAAVAQK